MRGVLLCIQNVVPLITIVPWPLFSENWNTRTASFFIWRTGLFVKAILSWVHLKIRYADLKKKSQPGHTFFPTLGKMRRFIPEFDYVEAIGTNANNKNLIRTHHQPFVATLKSTCQSPGLDRQSGLFTVRYQASKPGEEPSKTTLWNTRNWNRTVCSRRGRHGKESTFSQLISIPGNSWHLRNSIDFAKCFPALWERGFSSRGS